MRRWLADGEQVVLRLRPHPRVLVWPIAVGILLLTGTTAALARLQPAQFAHWAPAVPQLREPAIVLLLTAVVLIEAAYPVRRVLRWAGTRYILTSRRFLVRQGNLTRRSRECVLAQVGSLDLRQKLAQRMVGAGQLRFHMAGGGVHVIRDVPFVRDVHTETQNAITMALRESIQPPPHLPYYADGVDFVRHDISAHLTGKELRQSGRNH